MDNCAKSGTNHRANGERSDEGWPLVYLAWIDNNKRPHGQPDENS